VAFIDIEIAVPGLTELGAGTNYVLTGFTNPLPARFHPQGTNHWGTQQANTGLIEIANDYKNEYYQNDPITGEERLIPESEKLQYNDQSLPRGGKFEVPGNWSTANENHGEHRIGINCDVPSAVVPGDRFDRTPESRWGKLNEIFFQNGSTRTYDETYSRRTGGAVSGPHWHLRFEFNTVLPNSYISDAGNFVPTVLWASLNREPSEEEWSYWTNRLAIAQAQSPAQLLIEAKAFERSQFYSAEYINRNRSDEDFISDLYSAYLQRDLDEGGFNGWLGALRDINAQGGNGREVVLRGFDESIEFAYLVSNIAPSEGVSGTDPGSVRRATAIRQSVPATMIAGQTYNVSVTMRNDGDTTWTEGGLYRLGSQNPQDNTNWNNGRVYLPAGVAVAPGAEHTFNFPVTAPTTPDTFNFQWRMVQDAVEWFGDYTPNVAVSVSAPAPPPSGSTTNLALGKLATQSSTGWDAPASRAVDGNTSGAWADGSVSHTNYDAQAWWQVDLGGIQQISSINFWLMTECCSSHSDFDVKVSNDGSTWTNYYVAGYVDNGSVTVNRSGRYVRIQLRGADHLAVAEVQVMGQQPPTNLALGQPATQSSTGWDAPASRAVDGNTSGAWVDGSIAHTDYEAQAWWQVDLGGVRQINNIDFWLMTECCSSHGNFDVMVSDDGSTWTSYYVAGYVDNGSVTVNRSGRYVRIQLRGADPLAVAEVQVMGW